VLQPLVLWSVELSAHELASHAELNFTRRYGVDWEGVDHRVLLGHAHIEHSLAHVD